MKKILTLLILALAGPVLADGPIYQVSPFMQPVLQSQNSAAAQTALGFSGGTIGLTVVTNIAASVPATLATNANNAAALNKLPPSYYTPAFLATNHVASFGAFPNGYVYDGINVGLGTTNLYLSCNSLPAGSPTFSSSMIGDRIIINFAGPRCRYYSGIISNVFSGTALGLYAPVSNPLTNFSYAVICTTNSEATNTLAIQAWLNSASNTYESKLILDPPNYYTQFLGSNSIGQVYVCQTNFQNVGQNNAMWIVPPFSVNNSQKLGSRTTVEIDGNFPYQSWGGGADGSSLVSFTPNETVLLIDGLGNPGSLNNSNFIGSSVFDTRNFVNPVNWSANSLGSLGIPGNDMILIMKNIAVFESPDSGLCTFNFSGAADGSFIDNCNVYGGDSGSSVLPAGEETYLWSVGGYPMNTNSICFMPPGNFFGTFCQMHYCAFYGEYECIGDGNLVADMVTAHNNSNVVELVGSPAITLDLHHMNLGANVNNIHARYGVNPTTAAPSLLREDIIDFDFLGMPSGQPINLISDDYWNNSSGVEDSLFKTEGEITFASNINVSATSYLSYTNWDISQTQNGVRIGGLGTHGLWWINAQQNYAHLQVGTQTNSGEADFGGLLAATGGNIDETLGEYSSGYQNFIRGFSVSNPFWDVGVEGGVFDSYPIGDWVGFAVRPGTGEYPFWSWGFDTNGDEFLHGSIYVSNNIVIDGGVSNTLNFLSGVASYTPPTPCAFSATGITNTLSPPQDLMVVGFECTSGYLTNKVTHWGSILQNSTDPQTFFLAPNEAIIASGGAIETTNRAFP